MLQAYRSSAPFTSLLYDPFPTTLPYTELLHVTVSHHVQRRLCLSLRFEGSSSRDVTTANVDARACLLLPEQIAEAVFTLFLLTPDSS